MSNVVQLKKPSAKRQSKPSAAAKPDDALIRTCIAYAQNVSAVEAGMNADPTDNTYESMAKKYSLQANISLRKLANLPATTPEGLDAKARIVPMVIHDAMGLLDEPEQLFFASLAADVRKILDPIIYLRWRDEVETRAAAKQQAK
jgi:hypothetical protein